MRANFIDLTGQRFSRLAIIARAPNISGRTMWRCACDCGAEVVLQGAHIRAGSTISCGCFRKERFPEAQKLSTRNTTHGMSHTREFKSWDQMRQRCTNPKHHAWKWYGGKGVAVCVEWAGSFEAFIKDMGPRPEGCDIDRIDSDEGYTPNNCRWLDRRINSLRALKNARHVVEVANA